MDDIGSAIQSFLSQPGAMEQVEAMAKQLGLGGSESPEASETGARGLPELSPAMLQKISQAAGAAAGTDNAAGFLQALRPLMRPDRQEKLDRAIRALRLMRTAKVLSKTIEL